MSEVGAKFHIYRLRNLMVAGGIAYPGWYLILSIIGDFEMNDSFGFRLWVSLPILFTALWLHFKASSVKLKTARILFFICCLALTGQYLYLASLNYFVGIYGIGVLVVLMVLGVCFESFLELVGFFVFAILASIFLSFEGSEISFLFYLALVGTGFCASYLSCKNKQSLIDKLKISHEELTSYKDLLDQSNRVAKVGGWSYNLKTKKIRWSRETYRIYDVPYKKEIAVDFVSSFYSLKEGEVLRRKAHETIATGESYEAEAQLVTEAGELKHVKMSGHIKYENEEPLELYGVIQDISEIRIAQEQMIHSAKMASLGEMVAGIAHEINNPLSIIDGYASHLRKIVDSESKFDKQDLNEKIEKIRSTVKRISKIISSLKIYSREGEEDPIEDIILNQAISESIEICRQKFKQKGIILRVNTLKIDLVVCFREVQLVQIIVNFLNNAIDAVENLESKWVEINVKEYEKMVVVQVKDSGEGVDEAIAEKIMEPFFSTKPKGIGTGIGLFISSQIAAHNGGRIYLDRASENTAFCVEMLKKI